MKLSFEDTLFIRNFEGFSAKAYPDPVSGGNPWTIAWGLTGSWVVPGLVLTEEQAKDRFMTRIDEFCSSIDSLIKVPLSKNQYIAILDFTYNIGLHGFSTSTLLKDINSNQFSKAAEQFLLWNKAGGRVIPDLTRRRQAERSLFLTS